MSRLPVVVILGRPNVGKSTLVNRIVRYKAAVVDEQAGVTRDRREFNADWSGRDFTVVDTGGWEVRPGEQLTADIREQAEIAVGGADLVVFVTDGTADITDDDVGVARILQRSGVPYLFVANKVDGPTIELDLAHLWSLGLVNPCRFLLCTDAIRANFSTVSSTRSRTSERRPRITSSPASRSSDGRTLVSRHF